MLFSLLFLIFFARNKRERNSPFPCYIRVCGLRKLLSEAELLDNSSVSFDILLSEVVKELLSVSNHLGKTSLRVEVLGVLLHVLGEAVDSIGKDSNLNLGRTGILLIDLVLSDDGGLGFLSNHFSSPFLKFYPYAACSAGEKHKPRKGNSLTEQGHTRHEVVGQIVLYHNFNKK